eukprot:GILI01005450.1.p1 GENE.GILI01005450.1~~GILI01005450.1.p1  ORF type:complete len:408 (-),score=99.90 GILI01005450.1:101-1324(-)
MSSVPAERFSPLTPGTRPESAYASYSSVPRNEVIESEPHGEKIGGNGNAEPLAEAEARMVSEFDLAAYSKEDFTLSMQRSIMRRIFSLFALSQDGGVDEEQLKQLCQYLGRPLNTSTAEMTFPFTFDAFWKWWQATSEDHSSDKFETVSAEFAVPYHQQQLLVEESGVKYEPTYRVNYYFKDLETNAIKRISPWHDIPMEVRDLVRTIGATEPSNRFNFICEIPKWTRAKFEIATGEQYNPIKQDMKNGVPRFYKHGDMMWNYGAFPQTWESTEVVFEGGVTGDKDPIDCIEIGMTQLATGSVTPVKVIGVLGMIDDGQMDWKIIAVAAGDPIEKFINDIEDVPKYLPGCLIALREWLRVYKICQGGVENKFVFNGEYQNKAFALKLLHESHLMWGNLRKVKQTEYF